MTRRRLFYVRTLAGSVCLILVAFGYAAGQKSGEAESITSALQARDFETALQLLRPALHAHPENQFYWTLQGKAYAGEGRNQEALASFQHATRLFPDLIAALQGEAQIDFDAGDVAAIPILQHLLRLQPDDKTSHGMLAVLEYREGNCAAAVPHFQKAGDLFDSRPEALHADAVCLVRLKRLDQAAVVFERALAIEPENQQERQLLASLQLMNRQPQAAITTLTPSLGLDHPDAGILELASAAYEDSHDTGRAVSLLQRAIVLDPTNINLYLDFANISSVHQSFQVGINAVNDGIAQQPKAAPLYFARGVLYVQLGQYEEAQSDFERAYELAPNQSLSVAAQGLASVNANDLDQALRTVQENRKRKPDDPIFLYLEADILTQKGAEPGTPEFQLALASAKRAVALRPALGPARAVLAKLYLQSGRYAEAIDQCRKAIAIDPKDQTSLYRLIQALRKSGKDNNQIPALLKQLAVLRQEESKEERAHYRVKLVEGEPSSDSAH